MRLILCKKIMAKLIMYLLGIIFVGEVAEWSSYTACEDFLSGKK